jgi:hypothetical protein
MRVEVAASLALVLGGQVEYDEVDGGFGVGVTRPDGRYVSIDDDAGARYYDRHACVEGYLTCGSDPKGEIDAEEWGNPPDHHRFTEGLARLLGADWLDTGGGCMVVIYRRADGKVALLNEEVGLVFDSEASYRQKQAEGDDDRGDDGLCHLWSEGRSL